jgi:hypothetical protein
MEHALKTIQPYFDHIIQRKKTFEVRKNDREFNVGDILLLKEYPYTDREIRCEITYIMTDPNFVKEGFVIMGLKFLS